MTRHAARHPANVQQEPPAGPAPAPPEAPKAVGLSRGWRVALFIWASAFVCLLLYELLVTLVRSLGRFF